MQGSCGLMGHKMYCTSLTPALPLTMSSQTWRRECVCKNLSDRKEPGCAKVIGKKIACEMQLKVYDPEMRRQIDKQNILHVFISCAPTYILRKLHCLPQNPQGMRIYTCRHT